MIEFKKLSAVYSILYEHYGPQGWWPLYSEKEKKIVYRKNYFGPLSEKECFEIAAGAVLTQNITWKNAEKCVINLKTNNILDPEKLLNTEENIIYKLIRSSGYYKQKTQKLKNLSLWICKKGGDIKKIFKDNPDIIRRELLSIKGIGKETADSIMLYAAYIPFFVIDSYTKRLFSRIFTHTIESYDELQEIFHKTIPADYIIYNEFHALIVEISKNVCKKNNPLCKVCVLKKICNYGRKK